MLPQIELEMHWTVRYLIMTALFLCATPLFAGLTLDWRLQGVQGKVRNNIEERLKAAQAALPSPLTAAGIDTFTSTLKENTLKAMQPYGYFKPQITQQIQKNQSHYHYTVTIQPGPLLRLKKVDLLLSGPGARHPYFTRYQQHLPLKPGDPLLIERYENIQKKLFTLANNHGFIRAHIVKKTIDIDLKHNYANIAIHFATGQQYYFGPIQFGPSPISQTLLQRYITFKPGDIYSLAILMNLQNVLSATPYFDHVDIKPQMKKMRHRHIPLLIHMTPQKSKAYTVGLGYSTDSGIRGTLGWDWRRVNPEGHQLSALLQASHAQDKVEFNYSIPGRNPLTDRYAFALQIFQQDTPTGNLDAFQLNASYVRAWRNMQQTLGLSAFRGRNFKQTGIPNQQITLLYPSLNLRKVKADNTINTTQGYRVNARLIAAAKEFFSDVSLLQLRVDTKYIHSFNPRTRIILQNQLGAIAFTDPKSLPISLRFLTGGSQSIRGYNFQSIPNLTSNAGRYLAVGSIDLQHRIVGPWGLSVFYDVGDVFRNTTHFKQSAGVGIFRTTPIGPIQLGIAKAINDSSQGVQFVFHIGPDL